MRLTIHVIALAVADRLGLTYAELVAPRKDERLVRARWVVAHVARRRLPDHSLPMIGRALGGRDHTTILYGLRQIEALIVAGDPIAEIVRDVEAALDIAEEALRIGGIVPPADLDPLALATQALADPRLAVRLTVAQIRALASAVLVAEQERPVEIIERVIERKVPVEVRVSEVPAPVGAALRRLRAARQDWASAQTGRHEGAARRDLIAALDRLDAAVEAARHPQLSEAHNG